MTALLPARRIVTGHNNGGKAIIESDTLLYPADPRPPVPTPIDSGKSSNPETKPKSSGFILMFRTESVPAKAQGAWVDYHGKNLPLADTESTIVRIVDMQPGSSSPMHRTQSVDVGTVILGEIVLELDDGVETILKPGDTIIQRGTIHAWHNRTDQVARVSFVLVPAQPVVISGVTLGPTRYAAK